jgi:hypothetical protein
MAKKKQQYIVLRPISPTDGPVVYPGMKPTSDDPNPAPVLVDAGIVSGETDDEKATNLKLLIARGVLAEYVPDAPAEAPAEPNTAETKE